MEWFESNLAWYELVHKSGRHNLWRLHCTLFKPVKHSGSAYVEQIPGVNNHMAENHVDWGRVEMHALVRMIETQMELHLDAFTQVMKQHATICYKRC